MGLGAIDYVINCDRRAKLLVVTDIDESRLRRAASVYTVKKAEKNGVELIYINAKSRDIKNSLLSLTHGIGFDDVMVMVPVKEVVELGDSILKKDGCLNFFAGPTDSNFSAEMNFYNVHYSGSHVVGTTGGNIRRYERSFKDDEQGQHQSVGNDNSYWKFKLCRY